MKKAILAVTATALLLAGCAQNPYDNALLQQDEAQCSAGNRDACTAAQFQGQRVAAQQAQDAQTATTVAVVGGVALLGALTGVALANDGPGYYGHFHHGYYHGGFHHR